MSTTRSDPDALGALRDLAREDDTDSAAAEVKESLRAQLFPSKAKPKTIGRFEIRGRLGAGGMGVVYRGHDPRLDRPVAVKVLRSASEGSGPASGGRLEREAKALAKLDHPNVVTVLEVGEHDGATYVAMELIDGDNLKDFAATKPDPQAVMAAYRQAAAGLAAAHERGLVHRDFKPHNAMISEGGRVRVLDFGLVRDGGIDLAQDEATLPERPASNADAATRSPLTQTGAVLGTPAYMAPEQLRGAHADERSDQFSLCVSLWEALAGSRPFDGSSPDAILDAITSGPPAAPNVGGVSARTWRALRKGLSLDAGQRHADMHALQRAIAAPAGRRWMPAAALALGATGAVAVIGITGAAAADCSTAEEQATELWGAERQSSLEARLSADPSTAALWRALRPRLDVAVQRWSDTWDESCQAAPEKRRATRACLSERKRALAATMHVLSDVPLEAVATSADSLLVEVAPAADCTDEAWQRSQPTPPAAERADEVADVRAALADARLVTRIARSQEGTERTAALVQRAADTGYRPLEAEARLAHGTALGKQFEIEAAERELEEAVLVAEASRHDRVIAAGLMERMWTLGYARRFDDAQSLVPRATAAIERLGSPPWMVSLLETHEAKIAVSKSDPETAGAKFASARDRLHDAYGTSDIRALLVQRQRVVLLARTQQQPEALAEVTAILEALSEILGPDHPALHQDLDWRARLEEQLGRPDDVVITSERVLRASTAPNVSVARAHLRLGRIALDRAERSKASEHLGEARRLYDEVVGTRDPMYPQVLEAQKRLADTAP